MPRARTESLDAFARRRVGELVDRLEREVANVCRKSDADGIHDLRVSIRRLTQALRALRGLFSKAEIEALRAPLREMMNLAAEVRNRDIALELLSAAGVTADAKVCVKLASERGEAQTAILTLARNWRRAKLPAIWRAALTGSNQ